MTNFNLRNIVLDIKSLENTKNFTRNIEIFLIKVSKQCNEIYKQESDDKTKKILFDSINVGMNNTRFQNREVVPYDPVNSKKNTHELVSVSKFENIKETLDLFNDEEQHLTSTKGMDESKFHLYLVSLKSEEHSYKIIGSFSNVFELQKKFLLGNFKDSKIDFTNKNNVFGFNKKIEMIIVDDEYIVINQAESKFESLFKMGKLFSDQAKEILNTNEKLVEIFSEQTREQLVKKIENGKRMATRLIKITDDEERFNKTIENIVKIQEIIDDEKHKFNNQVKDVKFENGKLSVKEGKEIQLLAAISDAFYQAVISETKNVDESRM